MRIESLVKLHVSQIDRYGTLNIAGEKGALMYSCILVKQDTLLTKVSVSKESTKRSTFDKKL